MRYISAAFTLLVFMSTAFSQSHGWDFTAPGGEDTAMIVDGGSGPSTYGIVVGRDNAIWQAVTGIGVNGGKGVLGSDATGLVADGYSSYPAINATQHGSSVGIEASGGYAGVSGWGTGNALHYMDPIGVKGGADASGGFATATGVRGSVVVTDYTTTNLTGVDGKAVGNNDGYAYGLYGEAETAYYTTGVHGVAEDGYYNYGVKGVANNGVFSYGVYGVASGGYYENWAGFFDGDVNVTSTCYCSPSDEKLKKNVRPLDKGLSTILALQPKAYDMKVEEYKGKLNLAKGPQLGMIAQDVEKLVPEAVAKVTVPAREVVGEDGKKTKVEQIEYKNLNYVALVPVLVKAIQELEAKVAALEKAK